MKRRIAIGFGILLAGLWAPPSRATAASFDMTVVSTIPLNAGEQSYGLAVIDPTNEFLYSAVVVNTGSVYNPEIIEINLTNFQRVSTLPLPSGSSGPPTAGAIDTVNRFAYFAVSTAGVGATLYKIDLVGFAIVATLTLNSNEQTVGSAVVDPAGGFGYFGTGNGSTANDIIKVQLSNMQRVATLGGSLTGGNLGAAAIDVNNGFAYFASTVFHGGVEKIRLSDFTIVGGVSVSSQQSLNPAMAIDAVNGFLYYSVTDFSDGAVKIKQLNLSTMLVTSAELDLLDSYALNSGFFSAVVDSANGFAYFSLQDASARVIEVHLPDLAYANSLTVSGNQGPGLTLAGLSLYLNGLVQVNLTSDAASAPPLLITVSPTTLYANLPGYTLTALGTNFASGATVMWNNSNRATTPIGSDEVTGQILASDITSVGTDSVTVINPDGQTSGIVQISVVTAPPPNINSLLPGTTSAGSPDFTLRVYGNYDFISGATVTWNSSNRTTTFVSAGELDALISAADVSSIGVDSVTVINPDGQTSSTATFTVTPHLPPAIVNLTPGTTTVGAPAFTLQVVGNNFVSGASVTWNGSNRLTTYVDAQDLQAAIPMADLATIAIDTVAVINPDGQTNAGHFHFFVDAPVPVITHVLPGDIPLTTSGPPVTLRIIGQNFVPGSVVKYGYLTIHGPWGQDLQTNFVSAEELDVQINPGDPLSSLAIPDTIDVNVQNPYFQNSNEGAFFIGGTLIPMPVISTLQPLSAIAGSTGFTLKVMGANFVSGSSVTWNDVDLPTTLVNPNELDAVVPMSDIASVGIDSVSVIGGFPEQASTNAFFPVLAAAPPVITSLSPPGVSAGNSTVYLTVFGSNFVQGASVTWNGSNLATLFYNTGILNATVPASDVAQVGIDSVTVLNPDGQTSSTATFTVAAVVPPPVITHLFPGAVLPGNSPVPVVLKIFGTGFQPGALIHGGGTTAGLPPTPWVGTLTTTFISAEELDALINPGPPNLPLNQPGNYFFWVQNPDGQTSNNRQFVVQFSLPTPQITGMTPEFAVAGNSGFTLKVTGANFVSGSTITWNAFDLPTTLANPNELDALIPTSDIANVGVDSIVVVTPITPVTPGEAGSAIAQFPVLAIQPPVPAITSLLPGTTVAGSPDFTLRVLGTNFVSGATVTWNNANLLTSFMSFNELDAWVPAADVASVGVDSVVVVNPYDQTSSTANFTVLSPIAPPVLTHLLPGGALINSLFVTFKIIGSGFLPGASVAVLPLPGSGVWTNPIPLADVTYVSPQEIDVNCPLGNCSTYLPGPIEIAVQNPASPNSNALQFLVTNGPLPPVPQIIATSPPSAVAGGLAFGLKVSGLNFVNGSTVTWNNIDLPTTFGSPSVLDVTIPASDIASVGIDSIVVITPGNGAVPIEQGSAITYFSVLPALPAPILSSLLPGTTVAGSPPFTLRVLGSNFVSGGAVAWNGTDLSANFISAGELDVPIPATDVASVGVDSVVVINPDLQTSTTAHFTVTPAPLPPPILTTLTPGTTAAGSVAFTLQVLGSNFVSGAMVTWNGSNLTTLFAGGGELDASISTADVASVGIDSVVVINPDLQTSTTGLFTVTPAPSSPPPILTNLQPGTTVAGSPAFILQVLGSNFVSGAVVAWNGANLPINFVSAGELDASIPAVDVASVGIDSVVVINPDLQTSTTGHFTVTPAPSSPPPILTNLQPGTTVAGSPAFTLQVQGSNFVSGAVVTWNGTNLSANFVNVGELDAFIPASDVVSVGVDSVVVINPDLQTSTTGQFTVTPAPIVIPPAPPAPSLDGIPDQLSVNSQIQIDYPAGYSIRAFDWSLQPENSTSGGSAASAGFAPAGGISFPTPAPQANLAPYNLSPGFYRLGVQVEDTYGQFSPQAQKTVTLMSADLSGVRVYPNPWQINLHQGYPITFDHMPAGSTVKIFTISGHWVATLPALNGQAVWTDLKNDNGNTVATGIYYYLITDGQGNKTHGKFGVIR